MTEGAELTLPLLKVVAVDAGKDPVLYRVVELNGTKVPGYFYGAQLTPTEAPKEQDSFRVEKVLKTKKVRGETFYYCKFLHYPSSYNEWIPKKNLVTGPD